MGDLRIALRGLMRSRGFAVAASVTLALGIAASTTIFSVLYGVLLRPLPYRDAGQLVVIQGEKTYATGPRILNFSAPQFEPFSEASSAFESMASSGTTALTLRNSGGVRSVPLATVSAGFFETLGMQPLLGRGLRAEAEPSIVISERLWREVFSSAPDVVGRTIVLADGATIERAYTIVGVMPQSFQLPDPRTDAWRPLGFARATGDGRVRELAPGGHQIFARLRDGVTFEAASADARAAVDRALKPNLTPYRVGLYAKTLPLDAYVRGTMGPTLWMLMGAVTLVLLVACANVASLMLTRQASRKREVATRLALGASPLRLLTYVLADAILLAAIGALGGIGISTAALRLLQWLEPAQLNRLDAVHLDVPVLTFATCIAATSALLAAVAPAFFSTRSGGLSALQSGHRGALGSASGQRLRSAIVVMQIAASIVLIVAASLFARTLRALVTADLGVNTEHVIAAILDLSPAPGRPMNDDRRRQIALDLEARLATLPRVTAVGIGSGVPPTGEFMRAEVRLSNSSAQDPYMVTVVPASPGYFRTLQPRLLAGRLFDQRDDALALPVVMINREAARRFFETDNPIGRTLTLLRQQVTIVGVIDNVKYTGIAVGPESVIYQPYAQQPIGISVLLARTSGDPTGIAAELRSLITAYDAGIGIPRLWTLSQWVSNATAQPRFRTVLMSSIAVIALCLAMVGMYGTIAYTITARTPEIGVRIAVGAQRRDIHRLVIGDAARLALPGAALGMVGAYWSSRGLSSFLYGVGPADPVNYVVAAAALLLVALVATWAPAIHAASVDPTVALRAE